MTSLDVLILAIALSMDACIVSFSNGLICTKNKRVNSLILATSVGFFQGIMPVLGWLFTKPLGKYLIPHSNYIIFSIFMILGLKFLLDALKKDEKQEKPKCYLCPKYILLVSIATSIDALAAGVTVSLSGMHITIPAIIIGVITFINSLIGFWSGHLFKKLPSKYLEIFASFILIFLAIKALFS